MKKIIVVILFTVSFCSAYSLSFLAKDGMGLKSYPGDIRSRSMGLTGITLSGDWTSSIMNPASTATQRTIVLGVGETVSSLSLTYDRFSGFSADQTSIDAPYINIIFPLPIKNATLTAYYYAPMNSYFQASFTHEYEHPDGESGEITDYIGIDYYKNFNIVGFSGAYALPFHLAVSLGLECAFGNDKNEYVIINPAFTDTTTKIVTTNKFLGYAPKFGVYYSYKNFSAGTVYRPSYDVNTSNSYNDTVGPDFVWEYPAELGIGVGYSHDALTVSAEYIQENWSNTSYIGYSDTEDLTRIGIGGEYLVSMNWSFLSEKEKKVTIPLRVGYYTQEGLYQNGKESAFSFGTSFKPFKSGNAAIDLMVSFGSREMDLVDMASDGIVSRYSEDFVTFGVSFTTKDLWFREKKK